MKPAKLTRTIHVGAAENVPPFAAPGHREIVRPQWSTALPP